MINAKFFYVPKTAFETWQAANDPNFAVGAELSDDGLAYLIPISDKAPSLQTLVEGIAGAKKMDHQQFKDFQANNPTIFSQADPDNPTAPGLPFHPQSQQTFEYQHLYDGTNATMTFDAEGDSTWVFASGTLNSVDDVIIGDDWIRIAKSKFGPAGPALNETRFIEVSATHVLMHVWELKTKNLEQDGSITVTLAIPPLPPPP